MPDALYSLTGSLDLNSVLLKRLLAKGGIDAIQIGKIRMSVSRVQTDGSRVRYSPFVRHEVEPWLRVGESTEMVVAKTGIDLQTISRWSEQINSDFQRVEIKSQNSSSQKMILRFENGVRISTPTTELMIEMLKVLK